LVLSVGYNGVVQSIYNENFRLCGWSQTMEEDKFEDVLARAFEMIETPDQQLNESIHSHKSTSKLNTAYFGATGNQNMRTEAMKNASETVVENWVQFKTAMSNNLKYFAGGGSEDPEIVTYVDTDKPAVQIRTGAIRVFTKASDKKEDAYAHLVPCVQLTPHAIKWLEASPKLGDIAEHGHLINLSNENYKRMKRELGRVDISLVTNHNGKFQVNYRTENQRYEQTDNLTRQYPSGYEAIIDKLVQTLGGTELANFYKRA